MRQIQNIYGGEACLLYRPKTREILQILDVIGGGGLERSVESAPLNGGNYLGALKTEYGIPENSLSITARQFGKGLFTTFENAEITEHSAEASGSVGPAKALSGSVADYTAEAIPGKEGNLPFGKVIVRIAQGASAAWHKGPAAGRAKTGRL